MNQTIARGFESISQSLTQTQIRLGVGLGCLGIGRDFMHQRQGQQGECCHGPHGAHPAHQLDQLLLENIARFKRPREYYFVSELPKNNYGKVLKTVLRASLLISC